MSSMTAFQIRPVQDDPRPTASVAHFCIRSSLDPSALPRILENFALRNLVPLSLSARQEQDELVIELSVAGLSAREESHLRLRMLTILPVRSVEPAA